MVAHHHQFACLGDDGRASPSIASTYSSLCKILICVPMMKSTQSNAMKSTTTLCEMSFPKTTSTHVLVGGLPVIAAVAPTTDTPLFLYSGDMEDKNDHNRFEIRLIQESMFAAWSPPTTECIVPPGSTVNVAAETPLILKVTNPQQPDWVLTLYHHRNTILFLCMPLLQGGGILCFSHYITAETQLVSALRVHKVINKTQFCFCVCRYQQSVAFSFSHCTNAETQSCSFLRLHSMINKTQLVSALRVHNAINRRWKVIPRT
ncbi:hypothetical protein BZA77DRAFT_295403 [Pyronema omphalodes]|nr:hypothetical protein BZA77DRAFT_295403 [Pyronema omphalodes]